MKWNKYSFKTTTDSVDIMSALLCDAGIEGIEVDDNVPLSEEDTKGMFIDILPDRGVDDGTATISFYLDPDDPELENKLAAANEIIGDAQLIQDVTADVDWINNWKQFFKPLIIGRILIQPSWEELTSENKDKLLIQIDPGTAFGTGGHETTQLCITQLEKWIDKFMKGEFYHSSLNHDSKPQGKVKGPEVIDIGTGSGILGIAALKLGAKHVFATDVDDNAIVAVHENMEANNIAPEEFHVVCGDIITDKSIQDAAGYEKYDIAVANILAPVIIELQKEAYQHVKHGGIFITSGIIDMKEADVVTAFEANPEWELIGVEHQGEWVSVIAQRR